MGRPLLSDGISAERAEQEQDTRRRIAADLAHVCLMLLVWFGIYSTALLIALLLILSPS